MTTVVKSIAREVAMTVSTKTETIYETALRDGINTSDLNEIQIILLFFIKGVSELHRQIYRADSRLKNK